MKSINFSNNIPLNEQYEIIIAGGGPSGCSAAIAAGRAGAKVLLIEQSSYLGGMGTGGLVPTWCPFTDGEKVIYKGIAFEVLENSKKSIAHIPETSYSWVPIDAEKLKIVYDELVSQAGVDIMFNTMLSAVCTDDNGNVESIVVSNKSGLTAYKAKVFIDCTGDADLAVWAGASYTKGDEKDGVLQPGTLCFLLANVDDYGFKHGQWLNGENKNSPVYDMINSEKYPLVKDSHMCSTLIGPGVVGLNAQHVTVDGTDPISVSKALIEGRQISQQVKEGLAEFMPKAFANSFVALSAPALGIRETRNIEGEYTLTLDDYAERKIFDDEICRNSYFIDVHSGVVDPEYIASIKYKKGESHGIPYRCLLPKGLNNVIVAGRSISCERMVQGSVRVMPVCLAMGEGAGTAAAMAVKVGCSVKDIDTNELKSKLKEQGAYIL